MDGIDTRAASFRVRSVYKWFFDPSLQEAELRSVSRDLPAEKEKEKAGAAELMTINEKAGSDDSSAR